MGRNRIGREVKVIRTLSVQLTIWETFKRWCKKNQRSMSDVIEMLLLRVMDEDRDILSLTTEADDVRSRIQLTRYKIEREKSDLDSLETDLNLLEERISVVIIEQKDKVKTATERFKEYKEEEQNAKI